MTNRGWIAGGTLLLAVVGAGSYLAGARAAGVPQRTPMTYTGVVTDLQGAPVSGSRMIELRLWDRETGGTTPVCVVPPAPHVLVAGGFRITLPDPCVAAVREKPDLWIEVVVADKTFGRRKINAVPYAIEAERATNAGGALETRLAGLEASKLAAPRDGSGVQRICTGQTPVGTSAWAVYGAGGAIEIVVDTTACNFTNKPIYLPVLAGRTNHWLTTGGSNPYTETANETKQFKIFVKDDAGPVTPAQANERGWHIQWMAIGN